MTGFFTGLTFARSAGFAYQITKDPEYARKAREALLNLDTGTVTMATDKALALGSYAIAYDLIQPTLDPGTDGLSGTSLPYLRIRCTSR